MAGELDQQAIEVSFKATKISYNLLVALSKSIVENKDKIEHGEQSLKKLNMQGRKLESIDLPDSDIKSFRKQLNKHSVDFSIMQNKAKRLNITIW
ncbi:MAG TPA: PcfB family protein [Corynebacteriales bacterium]|nr:PcfB family protein [Mycobacteriales bacterium]